MYFKSYTTRDLEPQEGPSSRSILRTHAEMYAIADKYDLPTLSELAISKFQEALTMWDWDYDSMEFLESISKVYDLTPESNRGLRDIVISYARKYAEEFREGNELASRFESAAHNVPGFAADLLIHYMDAPISGHCSECGPRQKVQVVQLQCRNCGKHGAKLES